MSSPLHHLDLPGLEEGPNGSWVVYCSPAKMILILLVCVVFVAIGVWIILSDPGDVTVSLAGWSGAVFFGACGLYSISRLLHPTPAIIVDSEGLTDRASAIGVGRLAWDEIDRIEPYQFSNQWMLGIHPRDLDCVLARQSMMRRTAARANMGLGAAPFNLPQAALPMKVQELARFLNEHYGVRVAQD